MVSLNFAAGIVLATLATAQLSHPPVRSDLSGLKPSLGSALSKTPYKLTAWPSKWLPVDCVTAINDEGLSTDDVQAYAVEYTDCSYPWVICFHKDSPQSINTAADYLGKLPLATREWVRHVVAVPDPSGTNAYANPKYGLIVFKQGVESITTWVHESGHLLDYLGAYSGERVVHESQAWLDAYNADPKVPDNYARRNQIENFAQNTVLASYNLNVAGGLPSDFSAVQNQYKFIVDKAAAAGNILTKGSKSKCTKRIQNSVAKNLGSSEPDSPNKPIPSGITRIDL